MAEDLEFPQCPEVDTSLAAVEGTLAASGRAAAEAHLTGCDLCQESVALLAFTREPSEAAERALVREVAEGSFDRARAVFRRASSRDASLEDECSPVAHAPKSPESVDRLVPPHSSRWRWMAAAAAIVLVGSAITVFVWRSLATDPDIADGKRALRTATFTARATDFRTSWQEQYAPSELTRSAGTPSTEALLEQAERRFAAAQLDGETTEGHAGLGGVAIAKHDYSRAVAELTLARDRSPRDAAIWTDLAVANAGTGDLAAARSAFVEALRLDPNRLDARFDLAVVSERLGERARAISEWDEYLARDAASPWADEARARRARLASTPG